MTQDGRDRRLFIVNPVARGGRGLASWQSIERQLADPDASNEVRFTTAPGAARVLAAEARAYTTLVAVGGDGTVGEVISGIMAQAEPRPRLAIVPTGTGNDIARQVGITTVAKALHLLTQGVPRAHDLFRVDFLAGGQAAHRYGFIYGTAGFTVNPMVKPWMKRWLNPTFAYRLGAVLAVAVFHPPTMVVKAAGRRFDGETWIVIAANTEWAGGASMRIAPGAATDDGQLNITVARARNRFEACFKLLTKVASGRHIGEPGVDFFPAEAVEVASTPPATIDIDGDVVGTTPATITIVPGALELLCEGK